MSWRDVLLRLRIRLIYCFFASIYLLKLFMLIYFLSFISRLIALVAFAINSC